MSEFDALRTSVIRLLCKNPDRSLSYAFLRLRYNISQDVVDQLVRALHKDAIARMVIRPDDNTKALLAYPRAIKEINAV